MEKTSIYGFGSFFNKKAEFKDIDLLIIHSNISYSSCQFSLLCKKQFSSIIYNADITILSESGERQFDFLKKSTAIFLGNVKENSFSKDIENIIANELKPQLLQRVTD